MDRKGNSKTGNAPKTNFFRKIIAAYKKLPDFNKGRLITLGAVAVISGVMYYLLTASAVFKPKSNDAKSGVFVSVGVNNQNAANAQADNTSIQKTKSSTGARRRPCNNCPPAKQANGNTFNMQPNSRVIVFPENNVPAKDAIPAINMDTIP